ncbi:MAG: ABC transporter permease [Phycisphaerae bacterium]|nr:ABC transporter permease [Phycisphaerae bacterium]
MTAYALQRLLQVPLVLLIVYAGSVLLVATTPGDPLATGERELTPEARRAKEIKYNYDQPWFERYFYTWPIKRLLIDRDLPAHRYEDWTVPEILQASLPVSLQLGLFAFCIALTCGTAVGILSAARRNTWVDYASVALAMVGVSLPPFVVGAALLFVFGLWLGVLPVGGWGRLEQIILPSITLSLPFMAYIARLTRAGMLDVVDQDYIRTARAKGVSRWRVLLVHAFKNAFLPVLSYLGPAAAAILTGSFVVEKIFNVPGMGVHIVESISNRDQTVILATVLTYSAFLILFNLLVDLAYGFIDPRIRLRG